MKKTIIAFLITAGAAAAATTEVWDLGTSVTEGEYLYDSTTGLFSDNTAIDGTVLNGYNGSNQVQTNITFTLNLSDAQKVTQQTQLIKMDMSGDVGLCLTSTGLATTWGNDARDKTMSYTDLLTQDSVFTGSDGDKYITLTMVETYGSGVQIFTNSKEIITDGALRSSSNTSLNSVYVNSDYIEALQFDTTWRSTGVVNLNADFATKAAAKLTSAAVPEPTTATLSLLALAGLAARRRRK